MTIKKKPAFFAFFVAILLTRAGFVLAATLTQQATTLFNYLVGATISLAGLAIAVGGVYYLISLGTGGFKEEGISWVRAGLTGLLISVLAYLIIFTINPGLFSFDFTKLATIVLQSMPGGGGTTSSGAQIINYNEIPIGKLTEQLLTAKINCYDFDPEGNPIESDRVKVKDKNGNDQQVNGPTNIDHDRADCLLKLTDALEKKSLLAEDLGKQINGLLSQCSCAQYGQCDDCNVTSTGWNTTTTPESPIGRTSKDQTTGTQCRMINPDPNFPWMPNPNDATGGGGCAGNCMTNPACKKPDNRNEPDLSCCSPAIKNQIKGYLKTHGDGKNYPYNQGSDPTKTVQTIPLSLTGDCPANNNNANGSTGYGIYNANAGITQINGQNYCDDKITGNYYGLDEFYTTKSADDIKSKVETTYQLNKKDFIVMNLGNCQVCTNTCNCKQGDQGCLSHQQTCLTNYQTCLTNYQKCVKKSPWGQLNIIEQIMYLNQKIKDLNSALATDTKNLSDGENQLLSCPLARSYIDLKQTESQTDITRQVIMIKKGAVDIKNYCGGFSYGNSQCYTSCDAICPIAQDTLSCYKNCSGSICDPLIDPACINSNSQCLIACRNKQKCTFSSGSNNGFNTFGDCMTGCQSSCQDVCAQKYLSCSDQYSSCQSMCGNDSSCILNNLGLCIFNPTPLGLGSCSNNQNNQDATNNCMQNSYTCKNGSQQFSGYPECLTTPYDTQGQYSSSFIYKNWSYQKCPSPYQSSTSSSLAFEQCKLSHPEAQDCPTFSNCPDCSCGSLKKTFTFSLEDPVDTSESTQCGAGPKPQVQTTCSPKTNDVEEYRIVGPQCSQPAYNDDPLTFYCRQDFWNDPETQRTVPLGQGLLCPLSSSGPLAKEGEYQAVPVGKTVDDAEKWASDFKKTADQISQNSQNLVNALQTIGNATGYCQCASKYSPSGDPVCKACCTYMSKDQNTTGKASCNFLPCNGNSCQQMIDWLNGIINFHSKIKSSMIDFYVSLSADPRADVLKELTYSRTQTNLCSAIQNISGPAATLKSCSRAVDELMSPIVDSGSKVIVNNTYISSYCYGRQAGNILKTPTPISDNWFCCVSVPKAVPLPPKSETQKAFSEGVGNGF